MRGLQFRDVRVLQSDLGFVDYHHRSTLGLINRRRENSENTCCIASKQDPRLLLEIDARKFVH